MPFFIGYSPVVNVSEKYSNRVSQRKKNVTPLLRISMENSRGVKKSRWNSRGVIPKIEVKTCIFTMQKKIEKIPGGSQ